MRPLSRQHRLEDRLDLAALAKMVALYESGETAQAVAQQFEVGKTAVLAVLRGAGVTVRRPRLTEQQLEQIAELHRGGMSQREIGRRLGRSQSQVWHALERLRLVGRR